MRYIVVKEMHNLFGKNVWKIKDLKTGFVSLGGYNKKSEADKYCAEKNKESE